jgi:DNA polymerase/3'-5' exonuclease PolX
MRQQRSGTIVNVRMKETVGDIDILAVSSEPDKVMNFFTSMPEATYMYCNKSTLE